MGALLGLVPLKDWIYLGLIAAILAGGAYEYHHIQALQAAKDAAADAKVAVAAEVQKAADTAAYTAATKTIQETLNAQLTQANATAGDLTRRLRDFEARRCAVLPGPAPAPAAGAGTPSSVEGALGRLIGAAEHDVAVINAERSERDALTGK